MGAVRQNIASFVMRTPALRRAVASLFPEVLALSARESEQLPLRIWQTTFAGDFAKRGLGQSRCTYPSFEHRDIGPLLGVPAFAVPVGNHRTSAAGRADPGAALSRRSVPGCGRGH